MNSNYHQQTHLSASAQPNNPFLHPSIGSIESMSSGGGGFKFSEKRAKLDWRAIEEVNVDQMILESDVGKLERHLQNVTFANIDKADLKRINDKNILKLFKLGQLSTEYLLYTQGVAE
jgi:hypothetical protein